ncbi:MAG TPA: twin-arginine translocase TatA/TatE family subunit, partial [Acidimicrobiales bacterium]|nr:twin-arginine translocase TatA/TatE family subunit [Acidimicrobiales bacterium]
IILLVVVVLFGSAKLPKFARSLGQAQNEFKQGLRDGGTTAADEPEADADAEARALRGAEAAPDRLVVDAATDQLAS